MAQERKAIWSAVLAALEASGTFNTVKFGTIEPKKEGLPAAAVIPDADDFQNRASKTHRASDLSFVVRVLVDDSDEQAGLTLEDLFDAVDRVVTSDPTWGGVAIDTIKGRTRWLYLAPDFPQAGGDAQYLVHYQV